MSQDRKRFPEFIVIQWNKNAFCAKTAFGRRKKEKKENCNFCAGKQKKGTSCERGKKWKGGLILFFFPLSLPLCFQDVHSPVFSFYAGNWSGCNFIFFLFVRGLEGMLLRSEEQTEAELKRIPPLLWVPHQITLPPPFSVSVPFLFPIWKAACTPGEKETALSSFGERQPKEKRPTGVSSKIRQFTKETLLKLFNNC